MQIHKFTIDEVEEKIAKGEIVDSKTICAMYYLKNLSGFDL